MSEQYDPMKDPAKHAAPAKTLTDKIIEAALSVGGGTVTLLSGLLAAVLIMYSGYVLYDTFATEQAASSSAWDLLQYRPELLEDSEEHIEAASLADINDDYRAWLTVYDTNIDYPVMQGPDDLYYASHNIYDKVSLTGAIYLAAGNSGDFSDSYNVIYGHHMDNGAMFGGLDHMDGSETGIIITGNEIYDVQFFAIINTDAYEHRVYAAGNRMNDVLDFLRSGGEDGVGIGTTVTYFNEEAAADAVKIVALSTCADTQTSGRLVVFGKMTKRVIMTDVTVTIVWDDADNQDGLRPESLTVTLSNGDTAELTAENNWTATLNVPKYDDNGEIHYTWTADTASGYRLTGSEYDAETKTTTLTNTHDPATAVLSVRMAWDDNDNQDGIRPDALTVTLLANGEAVKEITLTSAENWTASIADLPKYAQGAAIVYTWTAADIAGYTRTGISTETAADGAIATTITYTHKPETVDQPETVDLTVRMEWLKDTVNVRPAALDMVLVGSNGEIYRVRLSGANNWTATITGLPRYADGKEVQYAWQEPDIAGYRKTSVEPAGNTTVFTYTFIPTENTAFDWTDVPESLGPGFSSVGECIE